MGTYQTFATQPPPRWPCPKSSITSTRTARLLSTNRSTWSSMHPMSTSPCRPTLLGMTFLFMDLPSGSVTQEKKEHAETLIDYQNMRGGRVVFREIAKPTCDEWGTAIEAIEASLELEKTVNESILNMHKMADSHGDAQMTDFLEGTFMKEQVEAIKEIGDLATKMNRAGEGLGLHVIDKELLG